MSWPNGRVTRVLPKPIPGRIKEAREARGFTLESFADRLGKSKQAVAQFEAGQSVPSGETLASIIELTQQPPVFFSVTPARHSQPATLFWRALKRAEKVHRQRIARRIQWAADIVRLIDEFIEIPLINLPALEVGFEDLSPDDIENAAESLRECWGLGNGPVVDLAGIAEQNGIVLVREAVGCKDMDAVSCWIDGRPFALLAAETESGPRDLFNLAHEIGHLILHHGVMVTDENLKGIEKQANRFASAFLLPKESFEKEVMGTSIDYLTTLKKRWGVSIAAMATRCRDLGIFSKDQYSHVFRQMNYLQIRKVEPLDDLFDVSGPTMLSQAITMLVEHSVCRPREMEQRLGLNLRDVESIAGLPEGYLDTTVVHLKFR
ncbi:XRE family transcriptional regulator [Sphingosinicella sp. LY1275]|uniref:helix-turn-helix domain-containing protein n=1 Tax=Sphingosinicella sp. LY1275 TaxID=3095379 RepID=UPI002ADECC28|nr:XRE family transcriptional regulator [Sphingosinicella sp. LY1275]MEA1015622.1 XRE family transcriptional regulator [Sphingosinicella sp. LY1275]